MAILRTAIVAFVVLIPAISRAQLPLGAAQNAATIPAGDVRFSLTTIWWRYDATTGFTGATRTRSEPLGSIYSFNTLGTAALPGLAPIETAIAGLSEMPAFSLSLGATRVRAEVQTSVTPLTVEVGVTNWLTIGAAVPLVRTRGEVVFDVNPLGSEGSVGINPALDFITARDVNSTVRDQLTTASTALEQALATCATNPQAPGCSQLLPRQNEAQALIVQTRTFRDALEGLYGSDTTTPRAFIPLAGTPASQAIDGKLDALNTLFRDLLGLDAMAADPLTARPFPAQTSLTLAQLRNFLQEPQFGVGMVPLTGFRRQGLGDVEFHARVRLFDTFADSAAEGPGVRASMLITGRLGTGTAASPDIPFDAGTGDAQNDVEVGGAADVGLSRSLSISAVARAGVQMADTRRVRVATPGTPFPPAFTARDVNRDLGDYVDFTVRPHLRLGRYTSVTGAYQYYSKQADSYSGSFQLSAEETGGEPITLNASVLDAGTAINYQRAGIGLRLSNFTAATRRNVGLPVEFSALYLAMLSSSGYGVPQSAVQVMELRVYTGLFGGG